MQSDTMQANPTIGRLLKGQYTIEGELGRGAMGVVYKGTHVALGKPVAIKMLSTSAFLSKDAQERFEREAKTASMLVHPSVAQVFDYGIEDGVPFLVMEFVDGKEVADVISEEGPMVPQRAIAIMRQLASVLEEAHRCGIVHRDIKPQNLKLMRYSPGGQIFLKVLDFGIAKRMDEGQGKLTATGAVMGTPYYMAPEQASGSSKRVDGRADQYAAGVVLYEMLTGQVPFGGDSLAGVLVSHLTQPPPPLPKQVPEPLRQVVARMLRKTPDERFPDCGALDLALQAAEVSCRDAPALPRDAVAPPSSASYGTSHGGNQGSPNPGSQGAGRNKLHLGLALGAVAIAALVMGIALRFAPQLQGGSHTPKTPKPQLTIDMAQEAAPIEKPDLLVAVDSKSKTPDMRPQAASPPKTAKPTAEPPAGSDRPKNPEALAKLKDAEEQYQARQYHEAIQLARQAIGHEDSQQARRLIALSYCALHDLEMSKASFRQVTSGRKRVLDKCKSFDVDVTD